MSSIEYGGYRASWHGPAAQQDEDNLDSGIYELPDGSFITLSEGPAYNERPVLLHNNCGSGLELVVECIEDGVVVFNFSCNPATALHKIEVRWPNAYASDLCEIYFG